VRVHELVGQLLAERHPDLHVDEIHADGEPHEVGHLPAGDPCCALDHLHAPVGCGDQLRERDRVVQAKRMHGVHRNAL